MTVQPGSAGGCRKASCRYGDRGNNVARFLAVVAVIFNLKRLPCVRLPAKENGKARQPTQADGIFGAQFSV